MGDNKFALIIANDSYTDPDLHKLAAPSQDAKALARVLADPSLGGFEVLPFLLNETSYKVSLAIDEFFGGTMTNMKVAIMTDIRICIR